MEGRCGKRGMKDNWIRSSKWNSFFLSFTSCQRLWPVQECLLHFHFAPFSPINPQLNILPATLPSPTRVICKSSARWFPSPRTQHFFLSATRQQFDEFHNFSRFRRQRRWARATLTSPIEFIHKLMNNMLCVAWIVIPQTLTLVKLNNKEILWINVLKTPEHDTRNYSFYSSSLSSSLILELCRRVSSLISLLIFFLVMIKIFYFIRLTIDYEQRPIKNCD